LYVEASQRRNQLLEEARELQTADKIKAAHQLLAQAIEIQERLTALENECRTPSPRHQ
jgi:hypothetical protein